MNSIDKARNLRREQTKAESVFWNAVRNRQFYDLKWRRQVPVGRYIADFLCESKKLIIELDGGQHATDDARRYDKKRSQILQQYGYRVIRFWNDGILNNLNGILDGILDSLANELGILSSPHPAAGAACADLSPRRGDLERDKK